MKSSSLLSIRLLLITILTITIVPVFGAVKVAGIFSDNMVLQRGMNVPVWGTANGGEKITVTIGGFSCTTVTPVSGNWKVCLQVFEAGGPHELVVKGENEVRFKDVLFGEVWVASGQSNMQWTLESSNNSAEEVKNANYPDIRLFYVPRRPAKSPKADLDGGRWEKCTPESAKGFSAIAYFFGRDLYKELNVPIGLINCNWGGTVAEAWTSSEMLLSLADFKGKMMELEQGPNWEEDLTANDERARKKQDIIDNSYKGLEQGILKANYSTNDWPVVIAPNWEEEAQRRSLDATDD
ncbi:MAG: sialate O-acetylesterase [Cyclobacteriaceae bacterium]|nr:sialate O-acetylesterase [Cyclobacteriaceae bacterium]